MKETNDTTIEKIETRPGNRRVKGRRSAPKAENRRITKSTGISFSYRFREPQVGEFDVLATENGWWGGETGKVKLQKLIDAWKIDANDDEACFYAGISSEQLKYFQELHPELYTIKYRCRQNLGLIAKKKFATQVESGEAALTYLRLKRKDEGYNPRVEMTGANGRELYDKVTDDIRRLHEAVVGVEIKDDDDEYYDEDEHTQEHTGNDKLGDAHAGENGHQHVSSSSENDEEGAEILVGANSALQG